MTGIYKITSPTKKIYIGQAYDIEARWNLYKILHCKGQPRLYNSFKKYGFETHTFEVICECSIEELNENERYYQDAFCVTNKNGLNCRLTKTNDRSGKVSDETRLKMSQSAKGKIISIETRIKFSNANKGKTYSDETKAKIGAAHKGKVVSEETRNKMSIAKTGKPSPTRKTVLHLLTGVYFDSAIEASKALNYNQYNFIASLNGGRKKNKTNCIYV